MATIRVYKLINEEIARRFVNLVNVGVEGKLSITGSMSVNTIRKLFEEVKPEAAQKACGTRKASNKTKTEGTDKNQEGDVDKYFDHRTDNNYELYREQRNWSKS